MSNDTVSLWLAKSAVIPTSGKSASYYRSRLFSNSFGNNPFISAAQPIFSLLDRLNISSPPPPLETFHQSITHELLAFNSKTEHLAHNNDTHALTKFVLCATIDEIMGKNYSDNNAAHFKAFSQVRPSEKTPQALFFDLLNILKKQPQQYLDVLEFAYFCLIAGLEGPFHEKPNGRQELESILDDLFSLIMQHRSYRTPQPPLKKEELIQGKMPFFSKKNIVLLTVVIGLTLMGIQHYHSIDNSVKRLPLSSLLLKGTKLS